tara:strand:- start:7560 stop:7763 length:204 start_codon:yes stop_codon:yes gene_type:complete
MDNRVAYNISKQLAEWLIQGPDYTSITFSKRGDSIRVKVEMNGSPDEVLPVVSMARDAIKPQQKKVV